MRESFGGAFMLKLALVFLVIYTSFMAVAINYAKAFRVKNQVINIVEQYQFTGASDGTTINRIDAYLAGVPYNFKKDGPNSLESECIKIASGKQYVYTEQGACIISNGDLGTYTNSTRYYKVVTFIHINFNFFNIETTVPISGETKIIYINN